MCIFCSACLRDIPLYDSVCAALSAASIAANEYQTFTVFVIFKRHAFCIVDNIGFNRDLDFIDYRYVILFFRLFQS